VPAPPQDPPMPGPRPTHAVPRNVHMWLPHGQSRQTVYDECAHVVTGEGGEEGPVWVAMHSRRPRPWAMRGRPTS